MEPRTALALSGFFAGVHASRETHPLDFVAFLRITNWYSTKGNARRKLNAVAVDGDVVTTGLLARGQWQCRCTVRAFEAFCLKSSIGRSVWALFQRGRSAAAALPAAAPAAAAPAAEATPEVFDEEQMLAVKAMFDAVSNSTGSHPINFDDAWKLAGYSRKDNAKAALKGPGIDDEILFLNAQEKSISNNLPSTTSADNKLSPITGRPSENIMMTVNAFKHFCLKAPGTLGAQVREYFISLEAIAKAAIAVSNDVASGEVTVTANTPGGIKRLRELEGVIATGTKKSRALSSQAAAHAGTADKHDCDMKQAAQIYTQVVAKSIENRNAKIIEMVEDWNRKVEAIHQEQADDLAQSYAVAQAQVQFHALAKEETLCSARVARTEAEREEQRTAAKIREYEELKQQRTAETAAGYNEMLARQRAEAVAWLRERKETGEPLTEEMESTLAGAV